VAKNGKGGLANPVRLKPVRKQDGTLQVIVETPKGSRNKFAFDPEQKVFTLKKILPEGMSFPYDFGFLPQTIAPDGDPLDVLLLMDEPAYPGVMVPSRLIGVIEGEQIEGKKRNRNDRLLAVAQAGHRYQDINSQNDLPGRFIKELEEFFVNYHRLEGKAYKLLGCKGSAAAELLIRKEPARRVPFALRSRSGDNGTTPSRAGGTVAPVPSMFSSVLRRSRRFASSARPAGSAGHSAHLPHARQCGSDVASSA